MHLLAIAFALFAAAVSVFANPVVQRDTTQSVAVILTSLSGTVTPLANKLSSVTSKDATEENIKPIVKDISAAVTDAVNKLNLLSGKSSDVILASVDSTTTLGLPDVADLLSGVCSLVFQALEGVLQVVDTTIHDVIFDLVAALGKLVISLLFVVLSLVPGLLVVLLPLLAPVLGIITSLGLGSLLGGILASAN